MGQRRQILTYKDDPRAERVISIWLLVLVAQTYGDHLYFSDLSDSIKLKRGALATKTVFNALWSSDVISGMLWKRELQ